MARRLKPVLVWNDLVWISSRNGWKEELKATLRITLLSVSVQLSSAGRLIEAWSLLSPQGTILEQIFLFSLFFYMFYFISYSVWIEFSRFMLRDEGTCCKMAQMNKSETETSIKTHITFLPPVTQQTLAQLNESRAALGQLLDQRTALQTESSFAASVSQTGGALELRWRSAFRRTEKEIQGCRDIQDVRARWDRVTLAENKTRLFCSAQMSLLSMTGGQAGLIIARADWEMFLSGTETSAILHSYKIKLGCQSLSLFQGQSSQVSRTKCFFTTPQLL